MQNRQQAVQSQAGYGSIFKPNAAYTTVDNSVKEFPGMMVEYNSAPIAASTPEKGHNAFKG